MLFLEIRRNRKLAARRSPMFEKNRFAKVFMYCGIAFWAAYLLFIGVMLPFAFQESFPGMEPYAAWGWSSARGSIRRPT